MSRFLHLLWLFALLPLSAIGQIVQQSVDASCNWTTKDHTGATISTSASLQPGIDAARTSGYPLVVNGSRFCPINVATTTTFGPSNGASYTLRNVYLNSTESPVVSIDTMYNSAILWINGDISYTGSGAAYPSSVVRIEPANAIPNPGPDQPYPITKFSEIALPKLNNNGGGLFTVVLFRQPAGATVNTRFKFQHVNAKCATTNGITVFNPNAEMKGLSAFVQNILDFGLVDAFSGAGIQEGDGQINSATQPLGTNYWLGAITGSCETAYAAFQTFGLMNQVNLTSVSANAGTLTHGVLFSAGAWGNHVLTPQIYGTYTCIGSTGNKCLIAPF